jgi:alcohol dehydrogenase (cytochrome c)
VLIDGVIDGKPRKLVATAARNGYFFTLDRVTGELIVSSKFGTTTNWAKGCARTARPMPMPARKRRSPDRSSRPSKAGSRTGRLRRSPPRPASSTSTKETDSTSSISPIPTRAVRWGLPERPSGRSGAWPTALQAIDYRTGKAAWRHAYPGVNGEGGSGGLLVTAANLLFGGDGGGNLVAFDAKTGTPLWHSHVGSLSNGPQTYMVDGRQYVLAAVDDRLYAFALN